ncbi:alpha/beta hydrolase [Pontiella desulfatans]|nr:alpha/beta hydrolase [Pontiella desulfatans]
MTTGIFIRIAVYGGGVYLFLNLLALFVSDKLLFQPRSRGYSHLPNEVKIRTADGELINAVYHGNPSAEYTLLFSHGNAEDLGNVEPFMRQFHALGYSVLMYDYRGYGTSEGRPSYRKILDDAASAYRWLVEEKKTAPQRIIAHGRSLGGAVAVWTAAHHEVGGLIVESSFTSAFRVKTIVPLLPWDKFNSVKSMRKVDCPVLVMHGTHDAVLPFWHGKALYEAAPEPKQHLWIDYGEHNNYAYVAEDAYFTSFHSFMERVSEYHSTRAE